MIYWNDYLYNRAEKIKDTEKKIELLKKSIDFYPSNDLIFYELGRAYFTLSVNLLSDKDHSVAYLRESIKNFQKSLRSNPASYFSHFNLAQSLLYLSYFYPSSDMNSHQEFRKAASLAGENSQIFFEVAKNFLARWQQLPVEDRAFTLDILRNIVSRGDKERILLLLHIWEMNVEDYSIIERVLPEDNQIYRVYAEFLAEKSLSVGARQRSLAKAEFLEFENAKIKFKEGEQEYFFYRIKGAFNHFQACLNILQRIKFYQSLVSEPLINLSGFNALKKSAVLYLAKCSVEQGKKLKEIEHYLVEYLSLEDDVEAIKKVETYLEKRGLIQKKMELSLNDDLDSLFLELLLRFSQNQYKDIKRLGSQLRESFVFIPEEKKDVYVRILNLIGDSYRQINYFYDAEYFYKKSLELSPHDLDALTGIRRNYEKLGVKEEISQTTEKMKGVLSAREKMFKNLTIKKNRDFNWGLVLDGRQTTLVLHFDLYEDGNAPLLSVFFNGRIVWEDYLEKEILTISLDTNIGKNSLRVIPLNRDISLIKIGYH